MHAFIRLSRWGNSVPPQPSLRISKLLLSSHHSISIRLRPLQHLDYILFHSLCRLPAILWITIQTTECEPNVTYNPENLGLSLDWGWTYFQMGLINMHLIFLTSFLFLPKLFSMTIVSAATWWYLEQGGKGRFAMATTPARRSTTLPPEYRHTSAWLRTSCSISERDAILHTHTRLMHAV